MLYHFQVIWRWIIVTLKRWPWMTLPPVSRSRDFLTLNNLVNGATYGHSFNEIQIGTYTRPTQQCYSEWPLVILSDLAKYSMTWSVARSLCESWASCPNSVSTSLVTFGLTGGRTDRFRTCFHLPVGPGGGIKIKKDFTSTCPIVLIYYHERYHSLKCVVTSVVCLGAW